MRRDRMKVFGERNTGSTYLTRLLELNLPVRLLPGTAPRVLQRWDRRTSLRFRLVDRWFALTTGRNLGWKHRLVDPDGLGPAERRVAARTHFVTIVKNPYSWLLSLHRKPYHNRPARDLSLEEFLVTPWDTVGRERAPELYAGPVDLWNAKNGAYLRLEGHYDTTLLRYESLLADPATALEEVARAAGIAWAPATFRDHARSTKDADRDRAYYVDYYTHERWRERLSPEAVRLVNDRLDRELATRLGYAVL